MMPAPATHDCTLATILAERIRESKGKLVEQWIKRITEGPGAPPARAPSERMIEIMPVLVDGIAWCLEHGDEELDPRAPVIANATELGALRRDQGFDANHILEEYALLARLLFEFIAPVMNAAGQECSKSEIMLYGYRLFRAITKIETMTTSHFLQLGKERVAEREDRLRAFNRAVTHEIRNRIGAVISAAELLAMDTEQARTKRVEFAEIIMRNAQEMRATLDNLLVLARLEDDPQENRHESLREVIADVLCRLRPLARDAAVDLRVAGELPDVEVNAAARLLVTNYITNAIKYRDPGAVDRFAHIEAAIEERDSARPEVVVRVVDNGLGVPTEKRKSLFQRFFRAHAKSHQLGTGLGLSIVRETASALGGRAWAEFPEKGSRFSFALPCRRTAPRVAQNRRTRQLERRVS